MKEIPAEDWLERKNVMRVTLHFDDKTADIELNNEYWQILQRMSDMGLWYSFGRTAVESSTGKRNPLHIELRFSRYVQAWAYLFYVRDMAPLYSISELWANFTQGK